MIDTIKLGVETTQVTTDKLGDIIQKTTAGKPLYAEGHLGNLSIKMFPTADSPVRIIIEGSIRKYFFGPCALDDLGFDDFMNAIHRLSIDLNIPAIKLLQARIFRIDCGFTMQTPNLVTQYIQAVQGSQKIKGLNKYGDSGIQIPGTSKAIIMYDKYKELTKKRRNGCKCVSYKNQEVKSGNWLRFEVQWKKLSAVRKQLKGVTYLAQIPAIYSHLMDRVMHEMEQLNISLIEDIHAVHPIENTSDVLASALVYQSKGEPGALAALTTFLERGIITQARYLSSRKKITEAARNLSVTGDKVKDSLIEELRVYMINTYNWYKYDYVLKNVPAKQRLGLDSLVVKPVNLKHTKFTYVDSETGEEVADPWPAE